MLICTPLQERAHFESIGHHLGKLGEEGKIGHRVIDLTRPEDLDGKVLSLSLSLNPRHEARMVLKFLPIMHRDSLKVKAKVLTLSEMSLHTRLLLDSRCPLLLVAGS